MNPFKIIARMFSGWWARIIVDERKCPPECEDREANIWRAISRLSNDADFEKEVLDRLHVEYPEDPSAPPMPPAGCNLKGKSHLCRHNVDQVYDLVAKIKKERLSRT